MAANTGGAATSGAAGEGARPRRGGRSLLERVVAYKDLSKIDLFEVEANVFVAWTLIPGSQAGDATTLAILALVLLMQVGILAGASALDDVMGLRDGIDDFNYREGATLRKRSRKPLVDQRLSERQATRFARSVIALAVASGVAAYAVADFSPLWLLPATIALVVAVVGYSWGPKLSYHGGQEVVVIGGLAAAVSFTYAVATDDLRWAVVLEGLVLGAWLMQLTAFGNVHDREGDARAGRMTMAVRLSEAGNRVYLLALFAFGWAVLAAGVATGELPWVVLLLQAPVVAVQLAAIRAGVLGDDALLGRRLSIHVLRLGIVALIVANLIEFH